MTQRVCLPILCLLSSLVIAQTANSAKHKPSATPLSASKLLSIKVTGTQYRADDIIAASGLRLGDTIGEDSFKAATEKLGETGLFTDITYRYWFSPSGTKLELQLADNSELVPVKFDNYAWSSDRELIDQLHAQVPLFQGRVPITGKLLDQLASAFDALLAAHSPQLHGQYTQESASQEDGRIQSVVFSVEGVPIHLRQLVFPGADPSRLAGLGEVAKKISGGDYARSKLAVFAQLDLRSIYLKQGYLQVVFGQPEPEQVIEADKQVEVDVKLPVTEGVKYKLAEIEWSGNRVLSPDDFKGLIHLTVNQPVNAIELAEDFRAIERLYASRGYLRAHVQSQAEFKETAATVAYRASISEGDLYRMGDVDIEGLEVRLAARLRDDWRLRKGEPYDASYAQRFLREAARDLPHDSDLKLAVHESLDDIDKTVDVTLRFTSQP